WGKTAARLHPVLCSAWGTISGRPAAIAAAGPVNQGDFMMINRRMVLGLSGFALAGGLASTKLASAAAGMKGLHLVTYTGKPGLTWTTFDLLRPALQEELKAGVVVETVTGHEGLDAVQQVLQVAPDEPPLFGAALMAAQYAWRTMSAD